MQAASLPASSGWQWVGDGFRLFIRQPFALLTWALTLSLFFLFACITPPIGPLLFVALIPIFVLISLSACKHIAANEAMLLSMWLQPLKKPTVLKKLLLLGGLYAGLCLLAGLCAFLPFTRDLAAGFQTATASKDLGPLFKAMLLPFSLFTAFYILIAPLFWHAPALIAWHDIRLKQALFFSGVACWRNKGAFVVYGMTWAIILFGIDLSTHLLLTQGLPVTLINTLQILAHMTAVSIFYSSFYPTYTSVFNINHTGLKLDDGAGPPT